MNFYEEAEKQAGDFGLFQKKKIVSLYCTTFFSGGLIMLCSVFVVYTPPHRCFVQGFDERNSSQYEQLTIPPDIMNPSEEESNTTELVDFIPIENGKDGKLEWSKCFHYKQNLEGTLTNRSNVSCDEGWKYYTTPGTLSAAMEFNLVCDEAWLVPLVPSVMMFGIMVGSLIGGYLSDRFGRRFAMVSSWICVNLTTLLIAVLPVWKISYVLLFLMGVGIIIRNISSMVLLNELVSSRYRNTVTYLNMLVWSFSFMVIPLVFYLLENWRLVLGVYAGGQFLTLIILYCWCRESLKWLVRKGNYEKANNLLKEISKVNKRHIDDSFLLKDQNKTASFHCEKADDHSKDELHDNSKKLTYFDLTKIIFLRRRLIIFIMGWFAVPMSYYGLSINTNNLGGNRFVASFVAAAVEIPGDLIYYFSKGKFGGRLSYMGMTTMSILCMFLIPLFFNVFPWSLIVLSMIGKMFASGSFSLLLVFTGDLFPTLLRNQAYGASSFAGRIGAVVVPFVLYLGEIYHEAVPYVILGVVMVVPVIGMYFLPETRNTPLPDTIEDARRQDRLSNGQSYFSCSKPQNENEKTEEGSQEISIIEQINIL